MKTMVSKYYGTCTGCGGQIVKGEEIVWSKATGAMHPDCQDGACLYDEDEAAGFEPGTLANDRRLAKRGLTVVRLSSGHTYTQNARGRCEDAPCCGCCS